MDGQKPTEQELANALAYTVGALEAMEHTKPAERGREVLDRWNAAQEHEPQGRRRRSRAQQIDTTQAD